MSDFNIPRITVDSHLDMCMFLRQEHQKGRNGVIKSDYLDDIKAGGVNVIVSAIYTDATDINGGWLQQATEQIAALYNSPTVPTLGAHVVTAVRLYRDLL